MNLKEISKILMFGKPRAFSIDEFESQMKYHNIELVKEFSDDISFLVDGRMMTPLEQDFSDELYEKKSINSLNIDVLEEELAKHIDDSTLLMSLKLSHDKDRLKSFIQNSCIKDELFFKLIKMYSWSNEDFFENDDNRDVSAAFISRFYENIQRNHNAQFSATGFIHLVAQTKSPKLLNTILDLEPIQYHPKIKSAIAMSMFTDESLQNRLFKLQNKEIQQALSLNKKLNYKIIKEFLKDDTLGSNVAMNISLDEKLFFECTDFLDSLALNVSLSTEMQEKLFNKKSSKIKLALSTNNSLDKEFIEALLDLNDDKINQNIYENGATSVKILEEAYKHEKNHLALCKNENTPIDILYQLQLDSRYERYVKHNAGFGKHIQSENIGWLV